MQEQKGNFAVFVIDVNGLKQINDTYGHSYGNALIVAVSQVATEVFGREAVYRIGGDEFAVILHFADSVSVDELEQAFKEGLEAFSGDIKPSAAIGGAVYEKDQDSCYEKVFERADARMYENKTEMKSKGKNSEMRSSKELADEQK